MTAFEEFQRVRDFGELGWELLNKLVSEELAKVPALARHSSDEVSDYVIGFLTEKRAKLLVTLIAEAGDESTFGKIIRRSIKNWLIDKVRQTESGAFRRQVEGLLRSSLFDQVPSGSPGAGRWRLAGSTCAPFGGDPELLYSAARSVSVRAIQWKGTQRRSPLGSSKELANLLVAIFQAANGSLEISQIVDVFTHRFPAASYSMSVSLEALSADGMEVFSTEDTNSSGDPEGSAIDAEEMEDLSISARTVYEMLSCLERRMLPILANVEAVKLLLGCRKSKAYLEIQRLAAKIKEYAGGTGNYLELFYVLEEMCRGTEC